jgi:hypothetical protein
MTCRLKIEDLRDGHTFVIPVFEFSHLSFLCLKSTLDTLDLEDGSCRIFDGSIRHYISDQLNINQQGCDKFISR